jgi:SCY1-like protein 1
LAEETSKWGLYSIAVRKTPGALRRDDACLHIPQKTVKFINSDASSVHGSVRSSSIFTSESGEWKLGGFDVLSSVKEDDAIIYVCEDTQVREVELHLTIS